MLLILGGGLTGLSTGYHLKKKGFEDFLIIEKEEKPGGLCKSYFKDGFTYDYGGHYLHFRTEYAENLVKNLLKNNLKKHERKSVIYIDGKFIPYPFQRNLRGLSFKKISECLFGLILARLQRKKALNFKDWIIQNYGYGMAKYFFIPYNEKLWGELTEITTEWTKRFVPDTSFLKILKSLVKPDLKAGYNPEFYYPERGGIQILTDKIFGYIKDKVKLKEKVVEIDIAKKEVRTNKGIYTYEKLLNTIPLPEFLRILKNVPFQFKEIGGKLKCVSVYVYCIGYRGETPPYHWIYVPQKEFKFYRVGLHSNISANLSPENWQAITCESRENLKFDEIIEGLRKMRVIGEGETKDNGKLFIKYAYVIYNEHRRYLSFVFSFLESKDVFCGGRFGRWEYSTMEDSLIFGKNFSEFYLRNP